MFKLNPGLFALVSALTVVACRGEDAGTTEGSSSSSGDGTTGQPTTTTPTTSETDTSSSTSSSSSSGEPDTTTGGLEPTTGDNSGNFLTTVSGTDTDPSSGLQPNGGMCSADADCESMNCVSLIGGMVQFCGACNEDSDCVEAGTGTACTVSVAGQSADCSDGPPGSTCMSDEACMGDQFCDNVLDTPILPNTCGECTDSADCDMGTLCSPVLDLMMLSGNKSCVEPGSVANDQLCPSGNDGDDVCMSTHCTNTLLLGIVPVNICGECAEDTDCPDPGQTCTPAEASMNGFTGSKCT